MGKIKNVKNSEKTTLVMKKISKPKALRKNSIPKKQKELPDHSIEGNNTKLNNITSEGLPNVEPDIIENALAGVLKFHSENPKLKNQLFDEQFPLFLQISCYKVPRGNSKIYRIPLKHSLYNDESEICLIVSEVKGIKNSEHEQHKEYYENLFLKKGVDNIKNIMTFHEFRTEYETFEQKNRLVDLYDVFLADSKVSGKVVKNCGKIFYKKRKVPTSVKLHVTKLKEHLGKTLSKTFLHLHLKGNSYTVQIGHNKMEFNKIYHNIQCIMEFLEKDFPGGFSNVMGIQLFAPRTTSVPLYFCTKLGKDIEVPRVPSRKPKAFKTYQGELSTQMNAKVIVKPSGKVIVKKTVVKENEKSDQKKSKLALGKKKQKPFHETKNEAPMNKEIDVNITSKINKDVSIEDIENQRMSKNRKKNKGELQSNMTITPDRKCKKLKKSVDTDNLVKTYVTPIKKNKTIISIESGELEEEVLLDSPHLGDEIKVQKNNLNSKGMKINNKKFKLKKELIKSVNVKRKNKVK